VIPVFAEAANLDLSPWRFQAHAEVWVLVIALAASYVYAIRVLGPRVVGNGPVVSRRQVWLFVAALMLLWVASDWPIHDISEEYLYSVHMFQHMVLSYFVPPLVLLSLPRWLYDVVVERSPIGPAIKFGSRPVVAGLIFNIVVMVTHIPALVNQSVSNGLLHYTLHVLVVTGGILMWIPICGPVEERRLSYGGRMIYLFLMSVVPTVPAAWLTFAEGVVYKHYDIPVRVWGLSVTTDQQLAGAIMKTGGSIFLWSIIVFLFFRRFIGQFFVEQTYKVKDETLTFEAVRAEFDRIPAAREPD
jgi:putative membrane protein